LAVQPLAPRRASPLRREFEKVAARSRGFAGGSRDDRVRQLVAVAFDSRVNSSSTALRYSGLSRCSSEGILRDLLAAPTQIGDHARYQPILAEELGPSAQERAGVRAQHEL